MFAAVTWDHLLAGETEGQTMATNGVDGGLSDSNSTQDSVCISSVTSTVAPSSATVTTATTTTGATTTPQLPKVALKMKQVYQQDNTPARRKARLKEVPVNCVVILKEVSVDRVVTSVKFDDGSRYLFLLKIGRLKLL